jgi:hypothetical protein
MAKVGRPKKRGRKKVAWRSKYMELLQKIQRMEELPETIDDYQEQAQLEARCIEFNYCPSCGLKLKELV